MLLTIFTIAGSLYVTEDVLEYGKSKPVLIGILPFFASATQTLHIETADFLTLQLKR